MNILGFLGLPAAQAATTATDAAGRHEGSFWGMLWLPLLIIIVFYFLLIRPQSKRAKEHRTLLQNLSIGDEIMTAGGIIARVTQLKDGFVVIEISKGVAVTLQKSSIAQVLPKGTMSSSTID